MPTSVLVPVDGSHFAEHAIPYALAIARSAGATFHVALVHVPSEAALPTYPLVEGMEGGVLDDVDRESAYVDGLAERLAATGVEIRPALLRGRVAEALSQHVEEQGVEVVVMSTHGRGGIQRAWLGSTTDDMVRQCHVPVLLVRPCAATHDLDPSAERVFHRVLAALDGGEIAERALMDAVRLGTTSDASVVLLHVMSPSMAGSAPYLPNAIPQSNDELAAREAYYKGYMEGVSRCELLAGREVETRVVVDYDPAPAILEVAEEVGADLLVVGTHGRGGLSRVLLGSVADKVIRGTTRAVLVHRGSGGFRRWVDLLGRSRRATERAGTIAGG